MLRFTCLLAILLVSTVTSVVSAQNSPIRITISGELQSENKAVPDAVVLLMNSADKSLAKTEYTDASGKFVFQDIPAGNYFISISKNGQQLHTGSPFEAASDLALGILPANANTETLNEVVVKNTKQYIERKDGKMILNVENSIGNTGSSAFEVLEKAPGVNVDANDNISLRGKGGLIVQIDGKPTPMTGTNLANYLRGIPSNVLDKIEFISNPSAKYDASGTAIINIKMKKDKRKGTNGSVSVALGHGKYIKNNNNLSLNHRNAKVNLFGNYSFAYREAFNELLLNRRFYQNGVYTGAYDQDNFLKMNFRNHIVRAGADFFASKKHTFGIVANGISNKFNPTGQNYSDVYDGTNTIVSRFETKNHSYDNWHNNSVNFNHKFAIDTLGTELTTDLDFADFGNKTKQNFDTKYSNPDGSPSDPDYKLYGNIRGNLNIYAVKSDFVKTLKNKIRLETGIKSSYVKADNNLAFYNRSTGVDVYDPTKSNHFIYKENINAAYVNASKELGKKWSAQIGLRVENTNIKGEQLVDNTSFDDSYIQLFPSLFASYTINPKNSVEFNYSRRIQRPGYDQLNPFKFFLDPTTYKEGNPYLDPQTTHSIELTHVFNQKIFTTLSFSRTEDNITEVIAPSDTDPLVTVQTNKNLNSVDIYGLFFVVPVQVTKWWDSTNNLNLYVGSYSGTIANTTLTDSGNFTWNINSVNNFKLGNGFFAELSGNYRAKESYAFELVDPIWSVNTGIQKKFRKSTLKLAFNDVFFTNKTKATTTFTDYQETFRVRRDVRVATLSYTYNFGNGNAAQRRRTGGADDIKQRAGSGNG